MKKIILKTCLFIFLPIFLWSLLEGILPITTFTHRTYDAIFFNSKTPTYTTMYPNSTSIKFAVGDLCHHTENQIFRNEFWKTDKFGFRNDKFIQKADILFLGDSFFLGTGMTQDDLISNVIQQKTKGNYSIYNMSPSSMTEFDKYLRLKKIGKPKVLFFSHVERTLPCDLEISKNKTLLESNWLTNVMAKKEFNVFLDKIVKQFSLNWLRARLNGSKGKGIKSKRKNLYFLNGCNQIYTKSYVSDMKNKIVTYKNYCDSLGIRFVFIPMPNKETVYYDFIGLNKQPKMLLELDSILNFEHIETINTLKIYNNFRKNSNDKQLLYQLDDTHWNSKGIDLISKEIILKLKK